MRYILYIRGTEFRNDSERTYTHVVIGQRDEAHFKPKVETTILDRMTDEEKELVRNHAIESTSGRFRLKPLDWCASEEEAGKVALTFTAPEWINVRVEEITDIIPNA